MNKTIYDELRKQAISEGNEGGLENVIKYIDDYISKNPDTLEAYIFRSEFFTELEIFEEAFNSVEKAIEINPNEAAAYNNRACIYVGSGGDRNKALADYNKAIMLDPNYSDAYGNRANVYLKMKDFKKAIDDCTKAIAISPDECEVAYFNRVLAYMNLDEYEKALDDYNNVIRVAPDNVEAYAKRGMIYATLDKVQEAISDYEQFIQRDPDNKNAGLIKDELEWLKNGKKTVSNKEPVNKERRFLFTMTAIGFVLGTILGINGGELIYGMWIGIGGGTALSFLPETLSIFRIACNEEGFEEALKSTLLGGVIWFFVFMIAGPIGFIIRLIRIS